VIREGDQDPPGQEGVGRGWKGAGPSLVIRGGGQDPPGQEEGRAPSGDYRGEGQDPPGPHVSTPHRFFLHSTIEYNCTF
jgi:hypothetical protein